MADYRTMEAALETLAPYGPDLRNGLTSHAPMVAEALVVLERPDAVLPWLERYRVGMLARPDAHGRIAADDWRTALGDEHRFAEWSAFFGTEIDRDGWRATVARWTPRLAPAVCASATHGVIRTGHAVRSLEDAETPARLRELADGLGYWAAWYQTLPTATGTSARLGAAEAIARVPIVPPAERRFAGTIVSSLAGLAEFPAFATTIDLVDVTRDPSLVVSELTETFARVFLTNVHDVLTAIVFVHAVTSAAALRSLLPVLPDEAVGPALAYTWQAAAGLYATFASAPPATAVAPLAADAAALVDLAVRHGDEHAIKFTEACLREHAIAPSPAYLAAARLAISTLTPA